MAFGEVVGLVSAWQNKAVHIQPELCDFKQHGCFEVALRPLAVVEVKEYVDFEKGRNMLHL